MIFRSKTISLTFLLLLCCNLAWSQSILGVSAVWDDNLTEWKIYAEDEAYDGTLEIKWPLNNDWTEWEFEIYDLDGDVEMPRNNQFEYWEMRNGSDLVTIRTQWPGDIRQWNIRFQDYRLTVQTRYGDIADEWLVDSQEHGFWTMYTEYEGDLRDWIIEDDLDEDVPILVKMAILHIVLISSIK